MSTVLTAALLFKSSFVGAGLKREFTKARIFKIASIYGSYLRAGVIREAAVNTVDTVYSYLSNLRARNINCSILTAQNNSNS